MIITFSGYLRGIKNMLLKKLFTSKILILVMILLLSLSWSLPVQAISRVETSNVQNIDKNIKVLEFQDTDKFYNELISTLEAGKSVEVKTNYKKYAYIPLGLKKILATHDNDFFNKKKLKDDKISGLDSPSVANFAPLADALSAGASSVADYPVAYSQPNPSMFIILGAIAGTTVGAGVGLIGGGIGVIPGVLIGVGIGSFTGLFIDVAINHNYSFSTTFKKDGITIVIYPTT